MKTQKIHKHHILVVDDEPTVCRAIKMLLEHDGHRVQTVDGGETALVMFEQDKFDLIMTDYTMRGMNGAELAGFIKQRRPDQPIIMATAFAADFNTYGKPSGGVNLVIGKPFSQKELRDAIASVLP